MRTNQRIQQQGGTRVVWRETAAAPGERPLRAGIWPGKLNSFQRMMLNWEDLHPYVAVHALRLPRPLPHTLLMDSAHSILAEAGLNSISLESSRRRYRWGDFDFRPEVALIPEADEPIQALEREIARQLNRGFREGPHCPFRFFHLARGEKVTHLGMTYHHFVADAHSSALILSRILGHALGVGEEAAPGRLGLYPPSMRTAFPSGLSGRRAPVILAGILRDFLRYKRAFAPDYQSSDNLSVGFRAGAERIELAPVKAFAKEWGGTLQDTVFAAVLEALAEVFPLGARRSGWRRRLALAAAIDLRRFAGTDLSRSVGQFLGSFAVTHDAPPRHPFGPLVRDVARQTRRAKERGHFFGHIWSFALMDRFWPLFSLGLKKNHSRWVFPLAGALSNMNLSPMFGAAGVPFYLRAASTGPIMPLLVDVTTVGETFSLTTMFRRSAFSDEETRRITHRIRFRLENPAWRASA